MLLLKASEFGLPQRRIRLFIIGIHRQRCSTELTSTPDMVLTKFLKLLPQFKLKCPTVDFWTWTFKGWAVSAFVFFEKNRLDLRTAKIRSAKDSFLLPEDDEDVDAELKRREKVLLDRERRKQQREDQEDFDREEKWKSLHLNLANARLSPPASWFAVRAVSKQTVNRKTVNLVNSGGSDCRVKSQLQH